MRASVLFIGGAALYFAAKGAEFLNSITDNMYIEGGIIVILILCAGYVLDFVKENMFIKKEQ